MSLEDVIIYIRIKEQNRNRDKVEKAKELSYKTNMVEEKPKPNKTKPNTTNKVQNPTIKKKR